MSPQYMQLSHHDLTAYYCSSQLKKELSVFDPAFFEEIEDLKYNYHQAVLRNVELEDQIKTLTEH